jgi:hypothetical protein
MNIYVRRCRLASLEAVSKFKFACSRDEAEIACSRRHKEAEIAENANRSASLRRRLRILTP